MIDYAQQKWSEIKKVKDFLAFCEDPKINLMDFMETLIDIEKSSFWIAGNIAFDLDIDSAIESNPQIHHNEISTTTRTISEIEHHKKYNFGTYEKHTILINDNIKSFNGEPIKTITSAINYIAKS